MANGWGTLLGGIVLWLAVRFGGIKDVVVPEGANGLLFSALACLVAAWLAILVIKLAYAPIYIVKQRDKVIHLQNNEITSLKQKADSTINSANTTHKALYIEAGVVEPYVRRNIFSTGVARSGTYVRVRNGGDGFLSECIVSVTDINPKPDNYEQTALSNLGSLLKGEHKYVLIASLNEQPTNAHGVFNDLLGFAFPSGSLFQGWVTIPLPTEIEPALITIEVKALECKIERRQFKLWIDINRRPLMVQI